MRKYNKMSKKQIITLLIEQSFKLVIRLIIWYALSICLTKFGWNNNILSDIALRILAWRLSLIAYASMREVMQEKNDADMVIWDVLFCGLELINRKLDERESSSK